MNQTMTNTEEMRRAAGQRLMVGFEGLHLDDGLGTLIERKHVAGIILFSRNIDTPAQVQQLCADARRLASECGLPPLFIAVDQEGGTVARLKSPHFTEFPGNPHIKTDADARHFVQTAAAELKQCGFNMNMAPVLDVAPEGVESIMAERVFSGNPDRVASLGAAVVREFQANGIMAVGKHFPGIGRTRLDSHLDLPVMDAPLDDLMAFDLIPFAEAIRSRVSGMMFSHILYPELDPDYPASLSPAIAKTLLRDQMGYTGLTMTDDMDMGAIAKHYELGPAACQALDGDIDIILLCRSPENIEIAFETIVRQLIDHPLHRQMNDVSRKRIADAKAQYLAAIG